MRAWRTDARRQFAGATVAAALGLCAVPAAAQLGPPVPLVPQAAPPAQSAPAPAAAPAPAPASNAAPEDIEAQPLAPTDASWTGTLGPNDGALPQTMWRGTERSFLAAALPLVAPSTSPALQSLARVLLLSDAAAPAGKDPADRPSLAAIRLDRMLALGLAKPALEHRRPAAARFVERPHGPRHGRAAFRGARRRWRVQVCEQHHRPLSGSAVVGPRAHRLPGARRRRRQGGARPRRAARAEGAGRCRVRLADRRARGPCAQDRQARRRRCAAPDHARRGEAAAAGGCAGGRGSGGACRLCGERCGAGARAPARGRARGAVGRASTRCVGSALSGDRAQARRAAGGREGRQAARCARARRALLHCPLERARGDARERHRAAFRRRARSAAPSR